MSIDKIKQGNSFIVDYSINQVIDGVETPLNISLLEDVSISIQSDAYSIIYPVEFTSENNVVSVKIEPEIQKIIGAYRILFSAKLNNSQILRNPLAYGIVANVEQEENGSNGDINIHRIQVVDTINLSASGSFDTSKMWDALGEEGSEQIHVSHILDATSDINSRISKLEDSVAELRLYKASDLIVGYYYNTSQGVGNVTSDAPIAYTVNPSLFGCLKLNVKSGQSITIQTIGGNNSRAYALTDSTRKILQVAEANLNTITSPVTLKPSVDGFLYINCTPATTANFSVSIENDRSYNSPTFKNNPFPVYKSTLKVLAIGNSFTDDPTAYLDDIVISSGIDRSKLCLYVGVIGGSSLQTWAEKYNSNETVDIVRRVGLASVSTTSGTLKQIFSQDWDIVVLNQLSNLAINYGSLNPHLKNIRSFIRQDCTNQKVCIAWQSVWSYYKDYTDNPKGIIGWSDLCSVTKEQINKDGVDIIIPTGTAIQNARGSSLNTAHDITRDGHHLAFGIGRYIAACTWFQVLFSPIFNINIVGNTSTHTVTQGEKDLSTYEWADVTNDNKLLCQKAAFMATMDMYNLTYLQ